MPVLVCSDRGPVPKIEPFTFFKMGDLVQMFADRLEQMYRKHNPTNPRFPGGIFPRTFLLALRNVLRNTAEFSDWALFMNRQPGSLAVTGVRLDFFNEVKRIYLQDRATYDRRCRGGQYLTGKMSNYAKMVFKPMENNPSVRSTIMAYIVVVFGEYFFGFHVWFESGMLGSGVHSWNVEC